MIHWHLLTGEFPPQRGGVSDYVWSLSGALAEAGDEVHVWCPPTPAPASAPARVTVHRTLGRLEPADLRAVGRALDALPDPKRLLVQWVPHSLGMRSLNLPLCLWLLGRSRRGDRVEVMVHEPYLPFGRFGFRHLAAALVHRLMVTTLLRAVDRVWVSTPTWTRRWSRYTLGRSVPFQWLPIPSSVPVVKDPAAVAAVRARYAREGEPLVGHFGTYRPVVAALLAPALQRLLEEVEFGVLLLGRGSEAFRSELVGRNALLEERVHATGGMEAPDLSAAIQGCEVMLQPYPDGANGRQSSLSVLLDHGSAVVTTRGTSTEEIWEESGAVELVPVGDVEATVDAVQRLLASPQARARRAQAARELHRSRFDLRHTVAALRDED